MAEYKKDEIAQPAFTMAQVMEMMKAFAAELKKPTELEQKKIDDDRNRLLRQAAIRRNEAKIEEEARISTQRGCAHVKRDNSPAWGGQVNSDGYVRPMCTICRKIMPEIKAPVEWIANGVNMQDKEIFPKLTEEMLLEWHKVQGGAKPVTKPVGMNLTDEEKAELAKELVAR